MKHLTLLQIGAEDVVFHVEAARVDQLVELDGQDVRVAQDEGEDDGHCNPDQIKCFLTRWQRIQSDLNHVVQE